MGVLRHVKLDLVVVEAGGSWTWWLDSPVLERSPQLFAPWTEECACSSLDSLARYSSIELARACLSLRDGTALVTSLTGHAPDSPPVTADSAVDVALRFLDEIRGDPNRR